MIINQYNWGKFEGNPFVIGTTDLNEYFPVYTIGYDNNYNSILETVIQDVALYQKPQNKSISRTGFTRYDDLFNVLKEYVEPKVYSFTVNDETHYLTCLKGYIADKDDNILLLLGTKDIDIYDPYDVLKVEKLKLFVSTELIKNPIYKNLFKKLSTEYIDYCYQNDIEVVYTTSNNIQSRTFKNNFNLNINNLEELNALLNSGIGEDLFNDEPVLVQAADDGLPW